jgi:RimJ/RimL family protein N-acetyltransferase
VPICLELLTPRLRLRPWAAADAAALHPILVTNHTRLGPWIPARVADPVPVPQLAERLAGFAADVSSDREWRYAIFDRVGSRLLGEFDLFPRAPQGRVRFVEADRVEFGYWLRAEATGQGYVTEAVQAMLELVGGEPRIQHVEIHCDPENPASARVAERLGFRHAITRRDSYIDSAGEHRDTMIWIWPPTSVPKEARVAGAEGGP